MSNHTPGPWLIVSTYVRTAINTAQGIHVAMVNWGKGISGKEHEANARLVAAAPKMLEALEALNSVIDYLTTAWDDNSGADLLDQQISNMIGTAEILMKEALKKARGSEDDPDQEGQGLSSETEDYKYLESSNNLLAAKRVLQGIIEFAPDEVCYDEYAYERFQYAVRKAARTALRFLEKEERTRDEPGRVC